MTNEQLYLAIGIPTLLNAAMMGLLITYINAKFSGWDDRFQSVDRRFDAVDRRFDSIDQRFDDMRDLWRAELHRVEEVLDARLKHLERS
ncbi:MAG TPA: hypothetical protein VKG79_07655 [Bryobacteraceae bacterium]|nr:hypothetical protein [Bryobacteraceae bacterium]